MENIRYTTPELRQILPAPSIWVKVKPILWKNNPIEFSPKYTNGALLPFVGNWRLFMNASLLSDLLMPYISGFLGPI